MKKVVNMQKELIITEIFNPNEKSLEEKLQEVFIIFLTEKLMNVQK